MMEPKENYKIMLKVLGSSSKGNCYLLETDKHCLIIECGVRLNEVLREINFEISKIDGVIVSHEHKDHARFVKEYLMDRIDVYCSKGTATAIEITHFFNCTIMKSEQVYQIGEFRVMPFEVIHDATEPFGFLIYHKACGNILFITDTYYSEYCFENLNQIILECNHDKKLFDEKITPIQLQKRIQHSHISLDTCKEILKANDLTKVKNIVLIHLSVFNSDSEVFKKEIEKLTRKKVTIAKKDVVVDFSKDTKE